MDISQINSLFLPFNIEVICECCLQMEDKQAEKNKEDKIGLPLFSQFKFEEANNATGQMPVRQKHIRKPRTVQRRKPDKENEKNNGNAFAVTAQFSSPATLGTANRMLPKFPVYPPNQILNLNLLDSSISKQKDIYRILEDSMRTPFKIGDVEFENAPYSENKQGSDKHNFTHSTMQGFVFEFDDFGDEHRRERETRTGMCRFEDQIALSSVPSRDYSPCHTPVKFTGGTPKSSWVKTPNSALCVSPIYGQHFQNDGKRKKDSDFPMNLFYDAI